MAAVTVLPQSRPLRRDDLDALPDDGHRYELLDGVLLVSPSPALRHQDAVGALYRALHAACPGHLKVVLAPFDVVLAEDTVIVPDLLVADRAALAQRQLDGPPLLAVEVLSPSTRRIDRLLKRDRLQQAGCPAYWLVDPDVPSVQVLRLQDGSYVEAAAAEGDAALELAAGAGAPFAVRLVPSALVAD